MGRKTNVTTTNENGEFLDNITFQLNPGDTVKVISEGQRESYKAHEDSVEGMREHYENDKFIHLIYKYYDIIFKELQEKAPGNKCNIHIIRFIILATYQTFHGTLSNNGHRIKKSTLKKIWDTENKNGINETYNLLMECGYIYETEEGFLMINEDMVIKGAIKDYIKELRKQDSKYTCVRIFIDTVQEMYYGTEPKQRKILANLFKILPYINYKWNAFCKNPEETDITKLEPLTWTDLARICGYEENKHITKFKKDLMSLKVYGNDVIGEFNRGLNKKRIIVNPGVYYAGINKDDLKGIEDYFRMK